MAWFKGKNQPENPHDFHGKIGKSMVSREDFPQENQSIDIPYPIHIPLNR